MEVIINCLLKFTLFQKVANLNMKLITLGASKSRLKTAYILHAAASQELS